MMGKYVGLADSLQLKGQNRGAQSNLSLDAFSLFCFFAGAAVPRESRQLSDVLGHGMACGNWRRREDVGVLQRGKGAAPIQCVADSQVFNQIQFGSGAVGDAMASLAA
jgi:hypothetical protein